MLQGIFLSNAGLWFADRFSGHYLHNHSSHCFCIRTVNSPKWPSDLITIPSCANYFLSDAGLWLVDRLLITLLSYWNCERTSVSFTTDYCTVTLQGFSASWDRILPLAWDIASLDACSVWSRIVGHWRRLVDYSGRCHCMSSLIVKPAVKTA